MSYQLNYGSEAVSIPAAAIEKCENLLQVRLLMLLSYERNLSDTADDRTIADRLGCKESDVAETVSALRILGLLKPEKKLSPSVSTKNLDGEEMASLINSDKKFREFINECQNICSRIFTPTDVSKIVSMHKELGYDSETILLMFFYYSEKLGASGRKLTVSYVEKSAYSLYNDGIRGLAELQDYIKDTEKRNKFGYKIRQLLGIGNRKFTKKESRFFDKWDIEWEMPFELVEYAYDITVDATGKPSLEYMSKILSNWHDSGIVTLEQAEKSSDEYKKSDKYHTKFKEKNESSKGSSFDTDEFFEKALQRSYEMMKNSENNKK